MNLGSFIGNEDAVRMISDAIGSGRLPHAVVLQGEEGLGKRTLADGIAASLVCTGQIKPCGVCGACIRAKASTHPDIKVITGSGKSNTISVDSISQLIEDAYRKPEEADCSIYIIQCDNSMPPVSQNKLLKIIEEPPDNTYFIILVKSAESLLPTIRSRASIYTLKAPARDKSAEFVMKKTGVPREKAEEAAELCSGNIGRMLAFLKGDSGSFIHDTASQIARLVNSNNENELLKITFPLIKDKSAFVQVMDSLAVIFRDACVAKMGGKALIGSDKEAAVKLASALTGNKLMRLPEICVKYRTGCERNANMRLLVTCFCGELKAAVNK